MAKPNTPKSTTGGTPATVELSALKVPFLVHSFENALGAGEHGYGLEAAAALGAEPDRVFKTLLVESPADPGTTVVRAVGIVPVSSQLSLKAMSSAIGVKRVDMLKPADAERLTGYVVGGISPFGQKRRLSTVIDETAELWPTIFVSGGKRGLDIEIAPADLVRVLDAVVADIASN